MSLILAFYFGLAVVIFISYIFMRKSYRTSIDKFKVEPVPCPSCKSEKVRAGVLLGHKHLKRPLFSLDTDSFIPKHFLKLPKVGLVCLDCGFFWVTLDPIELKEHLNKIA